MRVPEFDLTKASPELRARLERRPSLNLYRALPYAGVLAPLFMDMGAAIRTQLVLDSQLRELAIIRIGVLTNARYEVVHHKRIGLGVGLSPARVAAVDEWRQAGVFAAAEQRVLAYADALALEVKAPESLFRALEEDLGVEALAELTLTIGFYLLVTRFLVNFEIDVEPEYEPAG